MEISHIIPFLKENETKVKIHCAIGSRNKYEPLYQFSKGKFREWQEEQNNKNFEREYILSLIYMDKGEWLFAGIYEKISVKEVTKGKRTGKFTYETRLLNNIGQDLIGKLVISFGKDFRASYLKYENYYNDLIVSEIRKQEYKFEPFPGYNNVFINFDLIREIINNNENSWKTALSNVKGIYLISDKTNGKLYVGSAYGDNAFWQRWTNYVENGHGGNKKLKEIISKNGYEYSLNFMFSILEIFNLNAIDEEIINKENLWKERLLTREYGYNDN